MKLTRRGFLKKSTAMIAALSFGSTFLGTAKGRDILTGNAEFDPFHRVKSPVLVVVQLSGGNDGLNTVIPYGKGEYYDARPTLGYKQNEVLVLDDELGLHPKLTELHQLYKDRKLAIVQGVGYPNPDHSHFRSMDIWQTGEPDKLIDSGWLGRYVSSSLSKHNLPAVQIGGTRNKAFLDPNFDVPVIQSLELYQAFGIKTATNIKQSMTQVLSDIYNQQKKNNQELLRVVSQYGLSAFQSVQDIQSLVSSYVNTTPYPDNPFAKNLQLITKLICGKAGTRVYYAQLGGFDDHAQEKQQHAKTLSQLDSGLGAFFRDLKINGMEKDVIVMVFSEFGRRLKENGSGGTDHGTAAPVFVIGDQVNGGLYGAFPSLTNLDNGDLKYEVDFRSVYYTLIDEWLRGDAKFALGGKAHEKLKFI
ncbi:DUF1501 domain-containing protein [Paenibacillus sp. GCM10027628]|uniref:DUF1501 domain-containing protein n=1 Tax=Paenibacillus sp. GCM10027628 TaxID=3273413 RepID=UPI00362D58CB